MWYGTESVRGQGAWHNSAIFRDTWFLSRALMGCTTAVWMRLVKKGAQHYAANVGILLHAVTGCVQHKFAKIAHPLQHTNCVCAFGQ